MSHLFQPGKIITGVVVNHTREEDEKYLPASEILGSVGLYTTAVGRKPKFVTVYNQHREGLAFSAETCSLCDAIANAGHVPVFAAWPDEEPEWSTTPKPTHSLNVLATDAGNSVWQVLGEQLRDFDRPIVLMVDEPSGFLWADPSQGAGADDSLDGKPWPRGPAQFIRMWRRMHGIIKPLASNVTFIIRYAPGWGGDDSATNPQHWWKSARYWWPGAEYVDAVGMNTVSYASLKDGTEVGWITTGQEAFDMAVAELLTMPGAESLPWCLGPSGSEHPTQPNMKPRWYADFLAACERDQRVRWVDVWCDGSYLRDCEVWRFPATAAVVHEAFSRLRFDLDAPAPSEIVCTTWLEPGWHTFPVVCGQDRQAKDLCLRGLDTQCDPLCHWLDGSIKMAWLTARAEIAGSYDVIPEASLLPIAEFGTIPAVNLQLKIGTKLWTCQVMPVAAAETYLHGPLMRESRVSGAFKDLGKAHPFLRLVADVREYVDGHWIIDLAIENCLPSLPNGNPPPSVRYTLNVLVNGQVRKTLTYQHRQRARQRIKLFLNSDGSEWGGLAERYLDWSEAVRIRVVPWYSADVSQEVTGYGDFRPMRQGALDPQMDNHGGRSELAPYPDWTARYLAHGDLAQLGNVLANGDCAAHWPVHLREADGSLLSVSSPGRANWWMQLPAAGGLTPDVDHQPSLNYIAWLATGDRFHADEMEFWANYILWQQMPGDEGEPRGLLKRTQTRGFAWGLRNLVDAAAWLPDSSADKEFFGKVVRDNLAYLDDFATWGAGPLGAAFHGLEWSQDYKMFYNVGEYAVLPDGNEADYAWTSLWMQLALGWVVDRANTQGFSGGQVWNRQMINFVLTWAKRSDIRDGLMPYYTALGMRHPPGSDNVDWFTDPKQSYEVTWGPSDFAQYYGRYARLTLLAAKAMGLDVVGDDGVDLVDWMEQLTAETNRVDSGWFIVG